MNMLNKDTHRIILVKILKEIYHDPDLRNILGFKGGTAAFLFYNLPRLSVDLDFDLLDEEKKNLAFEKIKIILSKFGKIIEATEKKYTLFFLLSYEKGERKIKIEISKRSSKSSFEVKNYLGISILTMKKDDIAAGKLSALLTRKKFAARDLFDLWYYLKNDWKINEETLMHKIGLPLKKALKEAIIKVQLIKKNQLLQGLGELLDEKQKQWVKEKLKEEVLFYLKLYLGGK
jgi:predicted nucleotidyltransferase component of viral defense system